MAQLIWLLDTQGSRQKHEKIIPVHYGLVDSALLSAHAIVSNVKYLELCASAEARFDWATQLIRALAKAMLYATRVGHELGQAAPSIVPSDIMAQGMTAPVPAPCATTTWQRIWHSMRQGIRHRHPWHTSVTGLCQCVCHAFCWHAAVTSLCH